MIAYIDESGDEGTDGKGSRWLILGCAMVSDSALVATRVPVDNRPCQMKMPPPVELVSNSDFISLMKGQPQGEGSNSHLFYL